MNCRMSLFPLCLCPPVHNTHRPTQYRERMPANTWTGATVSLTCVNRFNSDSVGTAVIPVSQMRKQTQRGYMTAPLHPPPTHTQPVLGPWRAPDACQLSPFTRCWRGWGISQDSFSGLGTALGLAGPGPGATGTAGARVGHEGGSRNQGAGLQPGQPSPPLSAGLLPTDVEGKGGGVRKPGTVLLLSGASGQLTTRAQAPAGLLPS